MRRWEDLFWKILQLCIILITLTRASCACSEQLRAVRGFHLSVGTNLRVAPPTRMSLTSLAIGPARKLQRRPTTSAMSAERANLQKFSSDAFSIAQQICSSSRGGWGARLKWQNDGFNDKWQLLNRIPATRQSFHKRVRVWMSCFNSVWYLYIYGFNNTINNLIFCCQRHK